MTETEHRIPVADGDAVVATHHEAPGDDWIVFCHGFLSDRTGSYEHRCRRAVERGFDAVRFDFRGRGDSDGRFVEQGLSDKIDDLRAVLEYFEPPSIVLFGSSFGGAVAFHAAPGDERVAAVVARAPVTDAGAFDEYRSIVEREGECRFDTGDRIDKRFFADLEGYAFADVAASLSVPVAIFHGADDASVDPADSFAAAAALETDVLLERFAGEGHRFSTDAEEQLLERTFHWLETQ